VGKQALDTGVDPLTISVSGLQQAELDRTLAQELADGRKLGARPWCTVDRDAIDDDVHDRIGSFARVCGVRTIW
jgi:hypothetical protein